MTTALTRFKTQPHSHDAAFSALDAKVLACSSDGVHVVTSPNMSFVPEPHIDTEELRVRADGRFGTADCFQWPQLYAKEWEWSPCILRKEFHELPDPLGWVWYTPIHDDLLQYQSMPSDHGLLKDTVALGLASLYEKAFQLYAPRKARRAGKPDIAGRWLEQLKLYTEVLRQQPLSYATSVGMVAQAQRFFLDILGFLDYVQIVQPRIANPSFPHAAREDWMGCFTDDINVCNDLFCAGVPVWFTRMSYTVNENTIINKLCKYTFPDGIVCALYSEPGKGARPFQLRYKGAGGSKRHEETRRVFSDTDRHAVTSIGKAPNRKASARQEGHGSSFASSVRARAPKGGQRSSQSDRNKWLELAVPQMPSTLSAWAIAMKRVGKGARPFRPEHADAGYRVPEPAMLVSGDSPERRTLYITNWLSVRCHWLRLVSSDPPARFPSPQMWRDLLRSSPSMKRETGKSSQSKSDENAPLAVFGDECPLFIQGGPLAPNEKVFWRGQEISLASLVDPPPRLMKAVLWEIFDIGFRLELRALDRLLVPRLWENYSRERTNLFDSLFTSKSSQLFWEEPLPMTPGILGMSDTVEKEEEANVLYRWCTLLSGWPNAPANLRPMSIAPVGCSVSERQAREYELLLKATHFYVQSFYEQFGRPPLVPHRFPVEFHP